MMEQNKLKEILKNAQKEVPYYMKSLKDLNFDESLHKVWDKVPLLEKEIVLENPQLFLNKTYQYFPKNQWLDIKRTSGSTGKYLKVYWDKYDDIKSLTNLWIIRKKQYGIMPDDKYCFFYSTEYRGNRFVEPKLETIDREGRFLGFSKWNWDEERLKYIYDSMKKFSPKYILSQPSVMLLLADYILEHHLQPIEQLQYIELTGEMLQDEVRGKIKAAFGTQIANQYGCNEINSIAMEYPDGKLHCMSDNVYIEIIKDGVVVPFGVEGEIYVTSLRNGAMPFIRYAVGDRGKLILDDTTQSLCLELSNGRDNDFVLLKNGNKLSSYVFLYAIEKMNEKLGNIIKQIQVTQTKLEEFYVKVAVKKGYRNWTDMLEQEFINCMKEDALAKVHWRFEFVSNIFPDNQTGKLAYFRREIGGIDDGKL